MLAMLKKDGWDDGCLAYADALRYEGVGRDVAEAVMGHWQHEASLDHFARQLTGVSRLDMDEGERREMIAHMNAAYLRAKQTPPPTLAECYEELRFWDRCPMSEAKAHFRAVGERLCVLAAKQGKLSRPLSDILRISKPSAAMRALRADLTAVLNEAARGRIAQQTTPSARLRTMLQYAVGVGGADIVDEEMWRDMSAGCAQAATANAESYLRLRELLEEAANGEMLDKPQQTLARMNRLLVHMDEQAKHGQDFDPRQMLTYWRSAAFAGIADDALEGIFKNFCQQYPHDAPQLLQDVDVLQQNNRQALAETARRLGRDGGSSRGRQTDPNKAGRRNDGFSGREQGKKKDGGVSSHKFIYWALAAVALLLILMVALQFFKPRVLSPEKTNQPAASERASEENNANDKKTKSPKPAEKTLEPEEAAPLSAEPTAEPTPEAEAEPIESAPSNSTEGEVPEESDVEEIPVNEYEETVVTE